MARSLLALAALVLLATAASAQGYPTDKGSILLDGAISFTSQGFEDVDERATNINVNPSLGYFIMPGLAIGAEVLLDKTSFDELSSTSLGVGPFVAYFFGGPASRTYPFISAGVNYVSNSTEGVDTSGLGAEVAAGAAFMVARNAALTASAFAQFSSFSAVGSDESFGSNTFGVRGGVAVFIF
jgi:hypothetical protein